MEASVSNMERWRGNTLFRINAKGARVIIRKRTKHLPKSLSNAVGHNRGNNYE
jgi:hypothetical protein